MTGSDECLGAAGETAGFDTAKTGGLEEATVSCTSWRVGLMALCVAMLVGMAQIPIHESAHAVACRLVGGHGCVVYFNISGGGGISGWRRLIQVAAGPLVGLITLGGLAIVSGRRSSDLWTASVVAAASVLVARSLLLVGLLAFHGLTAPIVTSSDEYQAAALAGIPPVAGIVGYSMAAAYLWSVVLRNATWHRLALYLPLIIAGGSAGTLLWLRWLGPILLPWR